MIIARRVGAAILAVAAFAVWFFMAPDKPANPVVHAVSDRSSEIRAALSDYTLNNARTQGAPQQAVVNGWLTRDLLTTIAEQQNEALTREAAPAPVVPNDDRIPALVGLLVLGLALTLITSNSQSAGNSAAGPSLPADHDGELVS